METRGQSIALGKLAKKIGRERREVPGRKAKNPKLNNERVYFVALPGAGHIVGTVAQTKKEALAQFLDGSHNREWAEYQKAGYRLVRGYLWWEWPTP